MSLRVGRCLYSKDGKISYPEVSGFTNIPVITRSRGRYSALSPYYLTDDQGRIMENLWQFSKLYATVPYSKQVKSRWDSSVIWEYPQEQHVNYIETQMGILPYPNVNYLRWREMGMSCPQAVRYPVGYKNKSQVLCSYRNREDGSIDFNTPLDYIAARKAIYVPLYTQMVKKIPLFYELKSRLISGENLLIIDVDGSHEESMDYYQNTYGVDRDFIQHHSVLVSEESMNILLNDPRHPFGRGYCLAMALME